MAAHPYAKAFAIDGDVPAAARRPAARADFDGYFAIDDRRIQTATGFLDLDPAAQ